MKTFHLHRSFFMYESLYGVFSLKLNLLLCRSEKINQDLNFRLKCRDQLILHQAPSRARIKIISNPRPTDKMIMFEGRKEEDSGQP
jgi:hypothetical protein